MAWIRSLFMRSAAIALGISLFLPAVSLAEPCSSPNKSIIDDLIELLESWGIIADSDGGGQSSGADGLSDGDGNSSDDEASSGDEGGSTGNEAGSSTGTDDSPSDFQQIAGGDLSLDDAPDTIELPEELLDGMEDAWNDSMPRGRSQEQGGLLVEEDDAFEWKRGEAGNSGSFNPNYDDMEDGETLVGVGHTHPYDSTEGGFEDVSFSGQDLARLVLVEDNIAVVQSGESLFLAARTEEFNDRLDGLSQSEKLDLFYEMKDVFDTAYDEADGTFQDRVRSGVLAVVDKYDLVYYEGNGSTLHRVEGGDE